MYQRLFCVSTILVMSTSLCAQYVEPDSVYTGRKNSILLLANPIVGFAMQHDATNLYYGLSYKRVLSNSKRLKIGIGHEYSNLSPTNQNVDSRYLVASSDSTITVNGRKETFNRTHIRGGIEWSDYSAKNAMFYGIDMQVGVRQQHYDSYNFHYHKLPEDSTLINPTIFTNQADSIVGVYDYDHRFFDFGFAVNLGYRIQIKEKWEVNLTFSPEFNVYFAPRNTWNLDTPEPLQYLPSNGFEMQLRMLLVDVGYRF